MLNRQLANVLREIRKRAAPRAEPPSDGELLDRYLAGRDEAAFTAIVERHGGLVRNVCRRVLPSGADAEDVCQAVFLVLARKAAGIRKKDSLGAWLHGTAYRLAANLRRQLLRRRRREQPLAAEAATTDADPSWREVRGVLDEELRRLPEKLRSPLLLCYLEGQTRDEAARCLGWTVGTLRGRLERGRELLRGRLTRRGLDLSAALLAALLTENVLSAALPTERVVSMSRAAVAYGTGAASGAASAQSVALAERGIRAMFLAKVKVVAACVALGLLLVGGGVVMKASGVALAPREAGERGEVETKQEQVDPPRVAETKAKAAWRSLGDVKGLNALDVPLFSADGKTMVVLDQASNSVQIRDARTGEPQKSIAVKKMELVQGFAVSADGGTIAVRGRTFHGYFVANRLALIDVRSGDEVQVVANDQRTDKVYDRTAYPARLALSSDGKRVAWSTEFEHRLMLWDRTTGKIREFPKPDHWPSSLAFSPDSKTLVCAVGAQLRFLDAADGKEVGTAAAGVYVNVMTFRPDGKSLALAGVEWPSDSERDRICPAVNILDLNKREVSKKHKAKTSVPNWGGGLLSASRQANLWVFSETKEASLLVWDLVSGAEEVVLRDEPSCRASISPDGTTLTVIRLQADRKSNVLSLWRRGEK